jgi:hypothetical protein
MTRLERLLELAIAFFAGAAAALFLVDRLLGGDGPTLQLTPFDEPGGGW